MFSREECLEFCQDNGVSLDPVITCGLDLNDANPRSFGPDWKYKPTFPLGVIAHAGSQLRFNPEFKLSDKRFPVGLEQEPDVVIRALVNIVNANHKPIPFPAGQTDTPHFTSGWPERFHACAQAEGGFYETIADIRHLREENHGSQVIADDSGPLFLIKGLGEASSLSLVDTVVNGIPYPKGSLFRINLYPDYETARNKPDYLALPPALSPGVSRRCTPDLINSIGFIRMTGLCLDPDRRYIFESNAAPCPEYDPDYTDDGRPLTPEAEAIKDLTIDEVRAIVAEA